ncbi:MAG TPA: tetratricopeptide repeat protein [Longimicrobiales bacterium]|jgi:tetratricopeptide (TPR) repeat protein
MPPPYPRSVLAPLLLVLACGPSDSGEAGSGTPPETPPSATVTPTPLPDGAQALSLLGQPLFPVAAAPDVQEAREADYAAAMTALEAAPGDPDALIWAGRRAAYLGRYREAIDLFTRGVDLHPDDARFLRHRGHRYVSVRELDRAIADFRRAVDLIRDTEDETEPDGQPNALAIPTSTLHFNIWYHLGLAHYLKGEMEQALAAYEACLAASKHPDSVVATSYWLVNTALRSGLEDRAREVLADIDADMDIIESTAYLDILLLHKGERTLEQVGGGAGSGDAALENVTAAYGVGNWHYAHGRTDEAMAAWHAILEREAQWAAFGFIAAEADIARSH